MAVSVFLLALGPGPAAPIWAVDRIATLTLLDAVQRESVVRRRERVWLGDRAVRIQDLTFGRDLLLQLVEGRAVLLDTAARTEETVSFEEIAAARKELLDRLAAVRARVEGTREAEELDRIAAGLSAHMDALTLARTGKEAQVGENAVPEFLATTSKKARILQGPVDAGLPSVYFKALAAASALPPAVESIPGMQLGGVLRFVFLNERVQVRIEPLKAEKLIPPEGLFEIPEGYRSIPKTEVRKLDLPPAFSPGAK